MHVNRFDQQVPFELNMAAPRGPLVGIVGNRVCGGAGVCVYGQQDG